MASTTKITTTFLVLVLVLSLSAEAQIMAPTPSTAMSPATVAAEGPATSSGGMDCMTVLVNMSSCLTFVEQGSKLSKPDKECCPALAGLLDSNPICLCQLLGDPDKIGIQIDVNRALKLPSMCSLETPPVSTCAALGIPVAAPTSSEIPASSPGGLDSGPAASPGNFASSPTTSEEKNNAAPKMAFFKMQFVLGLGIIFFTIIF